MSKAKVWEDMRAVLDGRLFVSLKDEVDFASTILALMRHLRDISTGETLAPFYKSVCESLESLLFGMPVDQMYKIQRFYGPPTDPVFPYSKDLHHGGSSGKESCSADKTGLADIIDNGIMEDLPPYYDAYVKAYGPQEAEPVRYGYPEQHPWSEDPGAPVHPHAHLTDEQHFQMFAFGYVITPLLWPLDPRAPKGDRLHPWQNDILVKLARDGKIDLSTCVTMDKSSAKPYTVITTFQGTHPVSEEYHPDKEWKRLRETIAGSGDPFKAEKITEPQYPQLHVWAKELTERQHQLVREGARLFIHEPKEVKMKEFEPGVPRKHMPKKMRIALLEKERGQLIQDILQLKKEHQDLARHFEDHLAKTMPEKIEGKARKEEILEELDAAGLTRGAAARFREDKARSITLNFNEPLTKIILTDDKGMKVASQDVVEMLLRTLNSMGEKKGTPLTAQPDPAALSKDPAYRTVTFSLINGTTPPDENGWYFGYHTDEKKEVMVGYFSGKWWFRKPISGSDCPEMKAEKIVWYKRIL